MALKMFAATARGMPAAYFTVIAYKLYPHEVPMAQKIFAVTARDMRAAYLTDISYKFHSHKVARLLNVYSDSTWRTYGTLCLVAYKFLPTLSADGTKDVYSDGT